MRLVEMVVMIAVWILGAGGFLAVLLTDWQPDPETVAALLFLTVLTVASLKLRAICQPSRS